MSRAAEVLRAQAAELAPWLDALDGAALATPSVLPGWRVAELVTHLGMMLTGIPDVATATTAARPQTIAGYLARYPDAAGEIRDREVALTEDDPAAGRDLFRTGLARLPAAPAATTGGAASGTVTGARGPIRWEDYLTTRVVELVVHADDLARSLPDRDAPGMTRPAVKLTVSTLAKVLAERAPGRSVELRVPPYVAVQCVEGPRHTRGTPPNVVEMDPLIWVRMAAGRLGWEDALASHGVRASGPRADLGPWLPVL